MHDKAEIIAYEQTIAAMRAYENSLEEDKHLRDRALQGMKK
jgi:hypothetical protein